jgi:hypothetical protein
LVARTNSKSQLKCSVFKLSQELVGIDSVAFNPASATTNSIEERIKIKNSRVRHEGIASTTGFGRVGLEGVEASSKPKETSESAAGIIKPQPPTQPVSERFPALEEQETILTFFAPEAREVKIAGSFNRWRPDATPLKNTGAGKWAVRLMLRSGQYEYRFVLDGRWSEDPLASQRVANADGDFNSVLQVPLAVRTSIL